MFQRSLGPQLSMSARHFPIVTLTGPRQSGKTTLVRSEFPDYRYVSLEDPDVRRFALEDPRGFLAQFDGRQVILEEAQRAPDLFSYIQGIVDRENAPGRFILTGSHNFLLMQGVSQSLAGRTVVLHLLPLSLAELTGREPIDPAMLTEAAQLARPQVELNEVLFGGLYPRIHDTGVPPRDWLASYYQTYLERDVRDVLSVDDIDVFSRFVRLCAGRAGQLLNLSGLATECGISHTTARRWMSVLEASFVVHLLRPHHRNFGKRLVKSPKLHFVDTGLLCMLLRVRDPEELHDHPARGSIFESFVVSEMLKGFLHRGAQADIFFWRDLAGHEVDVLLDLGSQQVPVEVKATRTITARTLSGLRYWRRLVGSRDVACALVHAGDDSFVRDGIAYRPWYSVS